MKTTSDSRLSVCWKQCDGVVYKRVDDEEHVLLCVEKDRFLVINPSAAEIWQALEQPSCVHQVAQVLGDRYKNSLVEREAFVQQFIAQLDSAGFVQQVI